MPPRMAVRDISFFERPVPFAKPFRFGAVVINASRAGLRARRDRGRRQGHFDRRQRRNDGPEMVRQARASVAANRRSTDCAARWRSRASFIWRIRLRHRVRAARRRASRRRSRPARKKTSRRSPRLTDRPKSTRRSWMRCCAGWASNFFDGMARNIAGIDARLSPDLGDADIAQFLAAASAAGARRDPAHRRHGRQGRRRGRRRRPSTKTPARAISSSSSTAIPKPTRRG